MNKEVEISEISDEELMKNYISGDAGAFEIVYRRRRDGLRRYFARQCRNEAVGAELAQEVWFKLVRACENGTYTADAKFTTYLYRMAKNQLIDWYRKHGKVISLELNNEEDEAIGLADQDVNRTIDPERVVGDQQDLATVMEGIENLSEVQRATLLMQLEGNMSYGEIAEAMETTKETVKTRLRYARANLKQLLYG